MLIDFDYLFSQYRVNSKGVLHVGAHVGQEAEHYRKNGVERVVWIEANPELFKKLEEHVMTIPGTICINACIGERDGETKTFHISSNDGQSSSLLDLGTHAIVHPDVKYIQDITVTTKTISTIFAEMDLDINDYTFINIDIQGAELIALRGMVGLLDAVDYAYLEVNKAPLYVGCALIEEIDSFMSQFDFQRIETLWAGNTNWGDAFYVKRRLL